MKEYGKLPFTHYALRFTDVRVLLTAVFTVIFFILNGTAFAKLTITANHDHIKIDFFYHGSTVSIRGVSEPGH